MNAPASAPAPAVIPAPFPARQRKWPRVLALLVVVVVLLALVAATFVLSYDGVRAVALGAGVSASLARFYPGVLDAALVIACAAALLLRDGTWWARLYAWLAVVLIIAVAGGTDAVHAMNVALPRKQTEAVVAAAPWVLVLLAFSLWITLLRQSWSAHRQPPAPVVPDTAIPAPVAPVPVAPVPVAPVPEPPEEGTSVAGEEPAGDDEGEATAPPAEVQEEAVETNATAEQTPLDYWDADDGAHFTPPASPGSPTEVHHSLDDPVPEAPASPSAPPTRLRRVRSTPVPPGEDEDETT